MACGNREGNVFTLEGAPSIAAIAAQNFKELGIENIHLREGIFEETLPPLLKEIGKVNLAFIDGNHREEPAMRYFEQILNHTTETSMIIFDDIHWSEGMEIAWAAIKQHPKVTLTIDLFFMGIVCINSDIKVKQHFVLRF
jgi:predicted O-methyltransferase YrrM